MCSQACGPPAIVASVDAIVAVGRVGLHETSLLQLCDAGLTDAVARGLDPSRLHPDRLIARVAAQQDAGVTRARLPARAPRWRGGSRAVGRSPGSPVGFRETLELIYEAQMT
jgi:hypothetical protein